MAVIITQGTFDKFRKVYTDTLTCNFFKLKGRADSEMNFRCDAFLLMKWGALKMAQNLKISTKNLQKL